MLAPCRLVRACLLAGALPGVSYTSAPLRCPALWHPAQPGPASGPLQRLYQLCDQQGGVVGAQPAEPETHTCALGRSSM
jgi:hypothetical protein